MLKYFKILGERCSGTNYLKELIKQNFLLEAPGYFGNKHFFGFNNYDEVVDELIVDNKIIKNAVVGDYFLFIAIIRCPFKWMNSFYRNPYYLPWVDEKTSKDEKIKAFLNQEWLSIKENKEIMEDRNYITGERYKNIFELRNLKSRYLMEILPNKVKNFIFIRYEDLINDYQSFLNKVKDFGAVPIKKTFSNVEYYKCGNCRDKIPFIPKTTVYIDYEMILNHKDFIKDTEKKLGYLV